MRLRPPLQSQHVHRRMPAVPRGDRTVPLRHVEPTQPGEERASLTGERVRDEHLAAARDHRRQQRDQRMCQLLRIEDVSGDDEIERRAFAQGGRRRGDIDHHRVETPPDRPPSVAGREADGIPIGIGGKDVGASGEGRERRQREAAAEFEDVPSPEVTANQLVGERDPGRPQVRPVRPVLRRRRAQERARPPGDLDQIRDQRHAHARTVRDPGARSPVGSAGVSDLVLIERDGPIATCVLNRPERHNALSLALIEQLVATLDRCEADGVRAIVVRGAGPSFAAGADISELATTPAAATIDGARASLWTRLMRRRTPTIAAVHGHALGGGCELALACDIVVAAESARFGLPETGLGIIPGAGGTQRLARAVGKSLALEMILAGRVLTGAEAAASGLAARCVADEDLTPTAQDLATAIASRAPIAQRLARDAVLRSFDTPLDAGLELERRAFGLARATDDADEGIAAFREKRPPTFEGR